MDETLERLAVPSRIREQVRKSRKLYHDVLVLFCKEPNLPPSRIYDLLFPLDTEVILLMMAKAHQEKAKKYISLYLTHLRDVKVSLTGKNLKAMGITPGPRYKKILADLLDAKLDGLIKNEDEEVFFVRKKSGLLRE